MVMVMVVVMVMAQGVGRATVYACMHACALARVCVHAYICMCGTHRWQRAEPTHKVDGEELGASLRSMHMCTCMHMHMAVDVLRPPSSLLGPT